MTSTAIQIPGYVVGTWDIDPVHSTVGFSVRHMMVSKVRGYFREFSGEIVTAPNPAESSVTATIDMDSIDTRQEQRDAHIRSADFFDVGNHSVMTFRSTAVRAEGEDWFVEGDLTLKGHTEKITGTGTISGPAEDAFGNTKIGLALETVVDRTKFGLNWNAPLPKGGFALSNDVKLAVELELVKA